MEIIEKKIAIGITIILLLFDIGCYFLQHDRYLVRKQREEERINGKIWI